MQRFLRGGASNTIQIERPKPGRRGLELEAPEGYVERLALAQEAEEMKRSNPALTWKQIATHILWPWGTNASGIKALEAARKKLQIADTWVLEAIAKYRKEKREKK